MVDILPIVAFKEMGQDTWIVLTREPRVKTKVEAGCDAIGVSFVVEIQGFARESAHHPVEEIVVRLDALVAILLEFGNETIGVPSSTNIMQVEDIKKRIGHRRITFTWHTPASIRAPDIDPPFGLRLFGQDQHCIEIGDEAILIDIDGDVAGFVGKHRVEVPVSRLVGETNARVSGLLIQALAEQVKFLVEATTIKLDTKLGFHIHL